MITVLLILGHKALNSFWKASKNLKRQIIHLLSRNQIEDALETINMKL